MALRKINPVYRKLGRRINKFPQGAPSSELLLDILKILFSENDAQLTACLPLLPFDAGKAARLWKMDITAARKKLDALARKGLLLDISTRNGNKLYVVPPPMAGFFEISLMRVRGDIYQKALSDLFYRYINLDDRFASEIDRQRCLGCGVCVRRCPSQAIVLNSRPARVVTPADMASRTIAMATERGQLQNLIFDNQALLSHRLMAALLGGLLKLPPFKQALANEQLRSLYIEKLLSTPKYSNLKEIIRYG